MRIEIARTTATAEVNAINLRIPNWSRDFSAISSHLFRVRHSKVSRRAPPWPRRTRSPTVPCNARCIGWKCVQRVSSRNECLSRRLSEALCAGACGPTSESDPAWEASNSPGYECRRRRVVRRPGQDVAGSLSLAAALVISTQVKDDKELPCYTYEPRDR